ncbi:MAG: DoxX family membrane protein [Candidatus Promineifilaceae bacterium]|nr:DoxX family membrane protein [Candidatus Promineifilaceae bacterium]
MSVKTTSYPILDEAAETSTFRSSVLGQRVSFEYSETWVGYALVAMRVVMGWILFQGGITKVLDPTWTAAGYLQHAIPEGNPFIGMFAGMAGNPAIDFLVAWGLTLTGFGLIIGALVRWNAFWGAFMMFMFYLASLTGGIAEGLPLEHGWVFDDHLVYVVLLFGLGAFGAGRVMGVDAIIERLKVVRENPALKLILG